MKYLFNLYYKVLRIIGKEKAQEWLNNAEWLSLEDNHKEALICAYQVYYYNFIDKSIINKPLDHRLMVYKTLKTYNLI